MRTFYISYVLITVVVLLFIIIAQEQAPAIVLNSQLTPTAPSQTYSRLRYAPIEVALVLGRHPACSQSATPELVQAIATEALRSEIPPRIFSALVAVESSCNQYAVSGRGAIGYTQVMPKIWKNNYDLEKYNLFKPEDNLHVGAQILKGLIARYGIHEALRRYQGLGTTCDTCDVGYATRIEELGR